MKQKQRRAALIFGMLLLMGGFVLASSCAGLTQNLPNRQGMDLVTVKARASSTFSGEYGAQDSDHFVMGDEEKLIKQLPLSQSMVWDARMGTIGGKQAQVFFTSRGFYDLYPLQMLYGSPPPPDGLIDGKVAILLEEDLAFSLFGSIDVVGHEVEAYEHTLIVSGVCKAPVGLPMLLSDDGVPMAYMGASAPYILSSYLNHNGEIQKTYGLGSQESGMVVLLPAGLPGEAQLTLKNAMGAVGKNAGLLLIEDVGEAQKLTGQTPRLVLLFLFLAVGLLLVRIVFMAIGEFLRSGREIIKALDARDTPLPLLWLLIRFLLILSGMAALIVGAYLLLAPSFILPARFIPTSWIDWAFYARLAREEVRQGIFALSYPLMWWELMVSRLSTISLIATISSFGGVLICVLYWRSTERDARAFLSFLLAAMIGIVGGYLLIYNMKLPLGVEGLPLLLGLFALLLVLTHEAFPQMVFSLLAPSNGKRGNKKQKQSISATTKGDFS